MTITPTPEVEAGPPEAARSRRSVTARSVVPPVLGLLAAAGLTVALLRLDAPPLLAYAPLVVTASVGIVVLALTRFSAFVLLLLAARAGVDSLEIAGLGSVNEVLSVAFLVAGTVWLAGDIRAGGPRTLTGAPSLALLGACALSLAGSQDPSVGVVELLRIASGLLMLEVIQRLVRDARQIRLLLTALMVSMLVPIGYGLFQAATGAGVVNIATFDRVVGTFRHPNPFAIYLVILLLAAIALFSHLGLRGRVLLAVAAAPALAVLLLTYTRTGWAGLVIGILVIGLLQSRRLVVVLVAGMVAALLLNPTAMERLSDLGTERRPSGATGNSLVWRLEYWGQTVELAEDQPVTGLGLGMVRNTAEEELLPHNDFVRTGSELGALGLAAYLWLLGALVWTAGRAVRATRGLRRNPLRGGAVAAAAALVAIISMSITSNVLSQVVLLWYTAAVVALAAPAARLALRRNGNER